jgi:hypothetical protein
VGPQTLAPPSPRGVLAPPLLAHRGCVFQRGRRSSPSHLLGTCAIVFLRGSQCARTSGRVGVHAGVWAGAGVDRLDRSCSIAVGVGCTLLLSGGLSISHCTFGSCVFVHPVMCQTTGLASKCQVSHSVCLHIFSFFLIWNLNSLRSRAQTLRCASFSARARECMACTHPVPALASHSV